ncbi:MAG: ATP-binding protein [Rhodocyclaceae bacterium]
MTTPPSAPALYPRFLAPRIEEALADTPVVLISGPRQSGKTTLARQLAGNRTFLTLDNEPTLQAALDDPVGLIRSYDALVIDEIQRAPRLLLAIKQAVDADRRPGRFLLTGSANLMTLPLVADSLAGRIENQVLLPLSQAELAAVEMPVVHDWIDRLFLGEIPHPASKRSDTVERVLRGGYPEAIARTTPRRRQAWAQHYLDMLIKRDIRDLARLDKLEHLPRLLEMLAQVSGQLCNFTQLGGQIGLDHKTVGKYLAVFEQMYLLQRIPAWAGTALGQLVKTPKLQFLDSGLLAALMEIGDITPIHQRSRFGPLLESFVFSELLKFCTRSERRYAMSYYRDKSQREVDFVIEDAQGKLIGIEVKSAATIDSRDFSGLRHLASLTDDHFVAGIILYDGDLTLPFGPRLWAVPLSTLWQATFRTAYHGPG